MRLNEIQKLLQAEVLTEDVNLSMDIRMAKASDLMSDVLSFCCSGALLITGLTNSQAVRTVEVADLCGIVFVRGKRPPNETIRLAKERKIPVLATNLQMYEACGILYSNGLAGI
jgi:hypothetical protein